MAVTTVAKAWRGALGERWGAAATASEQLRPSDGLRRRARAGGFSCKVCMPMRGHFAQAGGVMKQLPPGRAKRPGHRWVAGCGRRRSSLGCGLRPPTRPMEGLPAPASRRPLPEDSNALPSAWDTAGAYVGRW